MPYRETAISASILRAIFDNARDSDDPPLVKRLLSFFDLFQITLARYEDGLFKGLRTDVWRMDEKEYHDSFQSKQQGTSEDETGALKAIGDLGYSGSTFFTTANSKFLIKSLPRRFEHTFFKDDLLGPYAEHMTANPNSLLVRITDLLHSPRSSLGGILGLAPTHHIIMENVLYGKSLGDKARQSSDGPTPMPKSGEWETYDLKPASYFFPERDIAGGKLAPQSVKDRLVDTFPDKVRVKAAQRDAVLATLEADTRMLRDNNAIDYSLFLVRYPLRDGRGQGGNLPVPSLNARPSPWRTGIASADGKWVYRMVVLDFFWAKHKLQAKAMTGLVESYNVVGRQGPMSITTTPPEYRERFLKMVRDVIEVQE